MNRSVASDLTIDQLLAILPHRGPFLMVDRVVERHEGRSCLALKRITFGDPLVRTGPLPSQLNPFMLVEAMSQTAALAAARPGRDDAPRVGFLAAIRDFRVVRPPVPGETLAIRAEVLGRFGRLIKVQGTVSVDDETIGEAELTLSVPGEAEHG